MLLRQYLLLDHLFIHSFIICQYVLQLEHVPPPTHTLFFPFFPKELRVRTGLCSASAQDSCHTTGTLCFLEPRHHMRTESTSKRCLMLFPYPSSLHPRNQRAWGGLLALPRSCCLLTRYRKCALDPCGLRVSQRPSCHLWCWGLIFPQNPQHVHSPAVNPVAESIIHGNSVLIRGV